MWDSEQAKASKYSSMKCIPQAVDIVSSALPRCIEYLEPIWVRVFFSMPGAHRGLAGPFGIFAEVDVFHKTGPCFGGPVCGCYIGSPGISEPKVAVCDLKFMTSFGGFKLDCVTLWEDALGMAPVAEPTGGSFPSGLTRCGPPRRSPRP